MAYIRKLIETAALTYSIDTSRIGLIGHSNGGAMTLRSRGTQPSLILGGSIESRGEVTWDELGSLAMAIDDMASKLGAAKREKLRADDERRSFLAAIGHDLRGLLGA